MLETRIEQHFFDSADLKYALAKTLAPLIANAAGLLVDSITSGAKVLVCADGVGIWQAQYFAAQFMNGFERERPSLAALALNSLNHEADGHAVYAKQVQALGVPGDVLLTLHSNGFARAIMSAIEAAQAQDMNIIVLGGQESAQGAGIGERLKPTDVYIEVPIERLARVQEMHTLVLHCLCDAVDLQLLGEQEFS
jgi:D-sedoheptulose 7-phosphate isomerase